MEFESIPHTELNIPDNLTPWVVGYLNIDNNEFDFFLRDLPLTKVRIRALKIRKTDKYFAESNLKIKILAAKDRYIVPTGIGNEPVEAIFLCLEKLINGGKIYGTIVNKSYSGTPASD